MKCPILKRSKDQQSDLMSIPNSLIILDADGSVRDLTDDIIDYFDVMWANAVPIEVCE